MSLTVVVPAHNESRFITRCLEGLCAQSRPAEEVILVDDSSTDRTVENALDFARAHPSLNLRTVQHKNVRGYDIMWNYTDTLISGWSVLEKKPDFFAICDADTFLHSDYYDRVLSLMSGIPRAGIGGGELVPELGMAWWWRSKKLLGVYPYVFGCNRVYRSECWQNLLDSHDPMSVLSYVGIDSYHALLARALGWEVVKDGYAVSTAMRPPPSLVSSRLKGIGSYVLGYSLAQIVGRAFFNRDPEYLQGWLWGYLHGLPRSAKIQPLVRELFRRRILQGFRSL